MEKFFSTFYATSVRKKIYGITQGKDESALRLLGEILGSVPSFSSLGTKPYVDSIFIWVIVAMR